MTEEQELKSLVREFFKILAVKEESDSGRMFSPTYISCCRAMTVEKLDRILARMEELSAEKE